MPTPDKTPRVTPTTDGLAVSILQDDEGRTLYLQRSNIGDLIGSVTYNSERLRTAPRVAAALDELFAALIEDAADVLNGK